MATDWTIREDEHWLDDYVRSVISSTLPPLPAREQRFGSSVVRWWDGKPGDAVIIAEGGSIDDRVFAEHLCAIQLASHGYRRAQFSLESNEPWYNPRMASDSFADPEDGAPYDPARDADHEMHDDLYSGWSLTHDYDPRWDYGDELRPHWQAHPLVQQAQARLDSHGARGRVYAADLSDRDAVGTYINGTGSEEPVILADPQMHLQHTLSPEEAAEQMSRTIDHEYRHSLQDSEAGLDGPNFDEDDAENWLP